VIDAKLAHSVGSITGAIMSARTAVERIQRQKKVGSLTDLWAKEQLSPALFDAANEPRLWANATAHDDFDPTEITAEHVGDLLGFLDQVLDMVYLMPKRLDRAAEARKGIGQVGAEDADAQEPEPGSTAIADPPVIGPF